MNLPDSTETIHWIDTPTPLGSLTYAGTFVTDQTWGLQQMRQLEFFSFALLLDGAGRYRDQQGTSLRLNAGDCILVEPGHRHQYGCEAGDHWNEVYLCFKGAPFDSWMRSGRFKDRRVFNLGNIDVWASRWFNILQSRPRNHFEAVSLLAEIHKLINQVVAADHMDWTFEERLEASRQHLHSWPTNRPVDWDLLAKECGCSYETWRKAFSKQFEISPARFRRNALMRQAGRLMTRSSLSNEQLAEQFGCSDGFHFSKLFKSVMKLSPQEYRKQLSQKHSEENSGSRS